MGYINAFMDGQYALRAATNGVVGTPDEPFVFYGPCAAGKTSFGLLLEMHRQQQYHRHPDLYLESIRMVGVGRFAYTFKKVK